MKDNTKYLLSIDDLGEFIHEFIVEMLNLGYSGWYIGKMLAKTIQAIEEVE